MARRKWPVTRGDPPYHAYFEHEDGSWYMLWMTRSAPKTERGHPWHVHVTLDKHGTMKPVLASRWFEQPYGAYNWDFDTLDEAIEHFLEERYLPRIERGYRLVTGHIPPDWPTT